MNERKKEKQEKSQGIGVTESNREKRKLSRMMMMIEFVQSKFEQE